MAGVAHMGVDGGLVGAGAVCDHDLDAFAPAPALGDEEPAERSRAAVLDHGQGLAGVAVDDHGHIAVPLAHRGLIDQQHPAAAAAAVLGHQIRPRAHQRHHQMPAEPVAARHRADGHDPGVGHQPAGQPPRHGALELRMVLQEALAAVAAREPPPHPHQRRAPSRHLQVADLAPTGVVRPPATEPARRAPPPPEGGLDLHYQLARRVNRHREHADLTQVQPHPHNIGSHRGPPGSLISQSPIPAGPRPPTQGPSTTPLPTNSRRLHLSLCCGIVGAVPGAVSASAASHGSRLRW